MFKISPVTEPTIAKNYADICGIEYREGAFLYAATDCDSGELLAVSHFEILGEHGYIYAIKSVPGLDDFELTFILGRQTMNFIDLCGSHKCRASLTGSDNSLLRAIGFHEADGEFSVDMTGFFDGSHCGGH